MAMACSAEAPSSHAAFSAAIAPTRLLLAQCTSTGRFADRKSASNALTFSSDRPSAPLIGRLRYSKPLSRAAAASSKSGVSLSSVRSITSRMPLCSIDVTSASVKRPEVKTPCAGSARCGKRRHFREGGRNGGTSSKRQCNQCGTDHFHGVILLKPTCHHQHSNKCGTRRAKLSFVGLTILEQYRQSVKSVGPGPDLPYLSDSSRYRIRNKRPTSVHPICRICRLQMLPTGL